MSENPRPSSTEFENRFRGRLMRFMPRSYSDSNKRNVSEVHYLEFMSAVGNTTDGNPEEEADIWGEENGRN